MGRYKGARVNFSMVIVHSAAEPRIWELARVSANLYLRHIK